MPDDHDPEEAMVVSRTTDVLKLELMPCVFQLADSVLQIMATNEVAGEDIGLPVPSFELS